MPKPGVVLLGQLQGVARVESVCDERPHEKMGNHRYRKNGEHISNQWST